MADGDWAGKLVVCAAMCTIIGTIIFIVTEFIIDDPNDKLYEDAVTIIGSHINMSKDYFERGNYSLAISSCINAQKSYNDSINSGIPPISLYDEYCEIHTILGDAYMALSNAENQEENIYNAINAYDKVYNKCTPDNNPELYARNKNKLGRLYLEISKIKYRRDNTRSSINSYNDAIRSEVFSNDSKEYAQIQNNLGIAYRLLSSVEDKADNLNESIKLHENALSIYENDSNYSLELASTKEYLGIAYAHLSEVRDTESNLNKSRSNHLEALEMRSLINNYENDSQSQNNIGNVYRSLSNFYGNVNYLLDAIDCYNVALQNSSNELERAEINYNLGVAYCDLSKFRDRMENLIKSKHFYEESLKTRTEKSYPIYYADTSDMLAVTYMKLSEMPQNTSDRINYVDQSLANLSEAKRIRHNESDIGYATTLHNIGVLYIYKFSVTNDKSDLENAINQFNIALDTRTKEEYPLDYALTKYFGAEANRSLSHISRSDVEKIHQRGKAEDGYKAALDVYEKQNNQIMREHVSGRLDSLISGRT